MEEDTMKNMRLLIKVLSILSLMAFQLPGMVTPSLAAEPQASVAAAAPIALTITNPLPKPTTVTLTGNRSYTIYVAAGATITQNIDAGKYKFSYPGCLGKVKKGNLKLKKTTAMLKITPCKMANWSFRNADDTMPTTITLRGWVNYTAIIPPGQTMRYTWVADTYSAVVVACGETYNETWKVKGKKAWLIFACD